MRFESPISAEGNPDALRNVESFHAPADRITANVQAQLNNPQDIASANQFFKPAGGDQFLPTVGKVGPQGIEMSAVTPAGKFAAPPMTGLETQGLHLPPPGGEMAALSGAPGAITPGAEQISPLINMIMKMPGHIGLVSSFFEALGAFLAPAQEMLGHLVEGLDVGALFEHAGAASEALSGALESAGGHMSVDLNLLPADAPIFDQIGHGAATGDFSPGSLDSFGHGLGVGAPRLTDSFASAPRLEVGGSPSHPIFEQGPNARPLGFDGPNNNYLAMEPNRGFGATVGSYNPPVGAGTQAMPQPTATTSTAGHGTSASEFGKEGMSTSREHLLGDTTSGAGHGPDAHTQVANHQEIHQGNPQGDRTAEMQSDGKIANESYTVHKGDNLWDIARNHLGNGTRWQEIYDLNKSVLGDNPRMIMPGTELQLPGGDAIATGSASGGDYTVQSGDNLWDISKDHLAGGQNWHDLYQNNHDVIGSNPDMIHPGQHLHLDASAHGESLAGNGADTGAGAGDGTAGATSHAGADHSLASGSGHSHHLASHPHGPVHSHNAAQASAHQNVAQASQRHDVIPAGSVDQASLAQSVYQPDGGHVAGAASGAHHAAAVSHHAAAQGGDLKAQAQSLSSIQSYGDASAHTVDAASHVPNSQP